MLFITVLCCSTVRYYSSPVFVVYVRHCSLLFVTVHCCSLLFAAVRYCSLLLVTVRYCSLLLVAVRYYSSPVFVVYVRDCSLLFVIVRYCSLLFAAVRYCSRLLFVTIPHLYSAYDGQNSVPSYLVIAEDVISKQLAKDLKYSRQITVICSQNKRVVSVQNEHTDKRINIDVTVIFLNYSPWMGC